MRIKPALTVWTTLTKAQAMSSTSPTYHLRFDSSVAVCGAVALYPFRAVVRLDLFRVQASKYNTKVCRVCRQRMQDAIRASSLS